MSQDAPAIQFGPSSILLTIAFSLYYFALEPWAIAFRTILLVLTVAYSKLSRTRKKKKQSMYRVSPPKLVEKIERETKRTVTIEANLNDQTLATCNPQSQSPLYSKLPKELRDYIFELSCTQSPDERHLYDTNSYYYRPGQTARQRTYTALLQTCRRVWLESNALPMRQAEHAFWFQRGPYDRHRDHGWQANSANERDRYKRRFNSLTKRNLANVSHIRFFTQMFLAQELIQVFRMRHLFPRNWLECGFRPKRVTVTFRSTDWWNWEFGQPLAITPPDLLQSFLDSAYLGGVEEFALELEVEERKVDQLETIIRTLSELEGKPKLVDPTGKDCDHACKFVFQSRSKYLHWTRSPRINGTDYDVYKGMSELRLRATTLVWKNRPCELPDPPPQPAYRNEYHGVVDTAPGFTVYGRAPRIMFRPRALRERLLTGGWMERRFPEKEDEMRILSASHASRWQQRERERFEKMFGDIEARRLLDEWRQSGSLLKFVDEV